MSIKVVCACLMGLFFMVMPLYAQDQPSGDAHQPQSADDIVSKMQSTLNLTQDQVTAITPIIEKYTAKREELKASIEDGSVDKSDVRSQMKQLKEAEGQDLGQVLSTDQLSQWQQMYKQRRHKPSNDGNGSAPSESGGDNPPPPQE